MGSSLSDEEKSAIRLIALSGLMDVLVPEAVIRDIFPGSLKRLQTGLAGLVKKERYGESFAYHPAGTLLARWLVTEKFALRTPDELGTAWKALFVEVVSTKSFDLVNASGVLLRVTLWRLLSGSYDFVIGAPGGPLARSLLQSLRETVYPLFDGVTDPRELVIWAATLRGTDAETMCWRPKVSGVSAFRRTAQI